NEAYHDSLTGLATRPLFLERLATVLAAAPAADAGPVLLFIDLDRFKQVNDTLGHAAGDALLVGAAKRIQSCLRTGAPADRFGRREQRAAGQELDPGRRPDLRVGDEDVPQRGQRGGLGQRQERRLRLYLRGVALGGPRERDRVGQ